MAGMTDRLSDERLRGIARVTDPNFAYATVLEEREMASELLELRAKLAVGPVMPEVPSKAVKHALYRAQSTSPGEQIRPSDYNAIRSARLMEEQSR